MVRHGDRAEERPSAAGGFQCHHCGREITKGELVVGIKNVNKPRHGRKRAKVEAQTRELHVAQISSMGAKRAAEWLRAMNVTVGREQHGNVAWMRDKLREKLHGMNTDTWSKAHDT